MKQFCMDRIAKSSLKSMNLLLTKYLEKKDDIKNIEKYINLARGIIGG
jgi:hypothetical protein